MVLIAAVAMIADADQFNAFLRQSSALHQRGLEKFGKPYKLHSNQLLTSVFFALSERMSVTIAIEVGAFKAEFSRRFKHGGKHRSSLAIEANPYNYDAFKDELAAEGIIYHHAAVLDVEGPCTLQLSSTRQDEKMGFIRGNNSIRTAAGRTDTRPVTVPGTTLDALVAEQVRSQAFGDPAEANTVLWIDAEGALDLVIKGGQQTIRNSLALYTEVESEALWDGQSDFSQVSQQLAELGFLPFLRDCEYEPDQCNVIYINEQFANEALLAELRLDYENGLQSLSG